MGPLNGDSTQSGVPGVRGDSSEFNGVLGVSTAAGQAGVAGVDERGGNGVYGRGTANGVYGHHAGTTTRVLTSLVLRGPVLWGQVTALMVCGASVRVISARG